MRTNGLRPSYHFGLLVLITLIGGFAFGQNANNGEIKGTVVDSTGAVVGGVNVTITNADTGGSTATPPNSSGIYDVPSIPPCPSPITFSKPPFQNLIPH